MNYTIFTKAYRYTDTCFQTLSKPSTWNNQTETLGGDLSYDPASPGILHETFAVFNHTLVGKKPNMLFDLERDPVTNEVTYMHFYACLGKLTPLSKNMFSYLLYSRKADYTSAQIDNLMTKDRAFNKDPDHPVFDFDNLVYTNTTAWQTCSVLPKPSEQIFLQ